MRKVDAMLSPLVAVSKLQAIGVYGVYLVVSVISYQVFHELLGIGVLRNILASITSVLILVPFSSKLRMISALSIIVMVQIVLPLSITIFSLLFFVGVSTEDLGSALPEILAYGLLAWLVAATVLIFARAIGRKQSE